MATSIHSSLSCLLPFYTIPIFPLFKSKDFSFTCNIIYTVYTCFRVHTMCTTVYVILLHEERHHKTTTVPGCILPIYIHVPRYMYIAGYIILHVSLSTVVLSI